MSKSAAARLFGVSLSSVKRYARLAERGESLTPRKGGGRPPKCRGDGTGRVAESGLEGDGRQEGGTGAAGFRGRDGDEHFPFCHACLVTYGRASILLCAPQPWEEHHLARQHLPAYSPDLNPIEEAFGKMKSILRKAQLRSREALIEAIGRALDAITPQDAQSFLTLRIPITGATIVTIAVVYHLHWFGPAG